MNSKDFLIAIRIYNKLIEKGEINIVDEPELFYDYSQEEVRQLLDIIEREANCNILKINNSIYLIPSLNNEFLGFKPSEIKNIFGGEANMIDYYLYCYIIVCILYKFYSSKNKNAKVVDFVPVDSLKEFISNRLEEIASKEDKKKLEEEHSFNIIKVYYKWDSLLDDHETRTKTKKGVIKKIIGLLERQGLMYLDNEENIRTTKKLDDIMNFFYLDIERKEEIEKFFILGGA
ncbi:DUF6063 family protein [Defluviitalea phaphyphila]|uniref:DUF6063 family protein n=1 Tax=Defluviitalea phaphyphila TaxID=1473580 RepID=UPI0007315A1B|nr:DUF6063 family protein [Defluviitalea phaphyphila]